MLIKSVECKECESLIFSRTADDARECNCGRVTVFGGQQHFKYETIPGTRYEIRKINVNANLKALYDDWHNMEDNFGLICINNASREERYTY